MCTMMAGVMLVVLGATGLGTAVKYIPRPVIVGFTNGIAVLIASTQFKDFFGLQIDAVPERFRRPHACRRRAPRARSRRDGDRCSASRPLAIVVLTPRVLQRVPGHDRRAVRRHASPRRSSGCRSRRSARRFGGIPVGLPALHVPAFRPDWCSDLLVAGAHGGDARRHRVAAVGRGRRPHERRPPQPERRAGRRRASPTSCRRCSAGCRPPARSRAPPPTSGPARKTPVAGMIHALTLLVVLLFAAPLAAHIPLAVLAGDPVRRRLQHGRVARDPGAAASCRRPTSRSGSPRSR